MIPRLRFLTATVFLNSAFAAGTAMWFGDCVLAQEDKPARTDAVAALASEERDSEPSSEMPWANAELVWGQFYLKPDLYYGQSLPPAAVEAKVQHGPAVHLTNSEKADVSVRIALTALEHELVNPSVGWDGGRIVWRGRLKPGERLDIAGVGQARLTAADGSAREAGGDLEGQAPTLAAGRSDVFHFWHAGPQRDARCKTELRYGFEGEPLPNQAQQSIHSRRLAWVRDPYLVFHPIDGIAFQRGLFAEAHVVHQHLGHVPAYEAVRVNALPKGIDDPLWRDLPTAQLVRGREDGGPSCERNGLPADRRTRIQFVYGREGLAAQIVAAGAPAEEEKLVLRLHDKALEFAVTAQPVEGAALREIVTLRPNQLWRGENRLEVTPRRLVPELTTTIQLREIEVEVRYHRG